ncbi:similar to Saccharomyces cerevisiae YML051W GAL80 Transcriptional regulator involved in the repression of GAL genes in the absence of galactose [Maudiozyma saulgeensis]|uniref:Similar to Saccharomyces cerevisiae YML051W GAL80 Transcriptional regulator involved in the repression of GAL genes in the absence of galactose n=1 Tax=Maudiozyma saulgeensis TaxID=1789683 RepID=A0A1X7R296_9SACH|nr:similar to Saccharomyces cerevisiae YML051W GAL80 Transcriptional regulator involved in the repression of GAL genes in the absence of galactose [Kazachstania saulgeensis]
MTQNSSIKVGFVGLNCANTLAIKTHCQAILQVSSFFEISAIYNDNIQESLDIIDRLSLQDAVAYPSLKQLVSNSGIDMIVFTSNGEQLYDKIMSILDNIREEKNQIKYLLFEWSLNFSLTQTEFLANQTIELGIQTIISLQSRKSPYIIRAKELIEDGSIGNINSIEVAGNGNWFGYERLQKSPQFLYEMDARRDLVSYCFGHTIDALEYITGSYFSTINSMIFNNIPEQVLVDDMGNSLGKKVQKNVPDHLLFQGKLIKGNVPVSCSFKGGKPTKKFTKNLVIDIHGTKGDLKIEGDAGFIEISNLVLYHSGIKVNINADIQDPPPEGQVIYNTDDEVLEFFHYRNYNALVGNMAKLYQSIADFNDQKNGKFHDASLLPISQKPKADELILIQGLQMDGFPTLLDALALYRLVENVYKSNAVGSTLNVSNINQYP